VVHAAAGSTGSAVAALAVAAAHALLAGRSVRGKLLLEA
jgi:hypothetical protein